MTDDKLKQMRTALASLPADHEFAQAVARLMRLKRDEWANQLLAPPTKTTNDQVNYDRGGMAALAALEIEFHGLVNKARTVKPELPGAMQ